MQTMNISLPDPLKEFVDSQIAGGRYSSVSEYIRELIRRDEKRRAEERLEALLLEGLEGKESELTEQDFEDIRKGPWRDSRAEGKNAKLGCAIPRIVHQS